MSDQKANPEVATPVFRSVRPRVSRPATVSVSSSIQASGTLTGLSPDGRASVDVGGRTVEGRIIPAQSRITPTAPPRPLNEIEEEDAPHDDPSPC
jgi:hypothetical protein